MERFEIVAKISRLAWEKDSFYLTNEQELAVINEIDNLREQLKQFHQ